MNWEVAAESSSRVIESVRKSIPTIIVLLVMGGGWMLMHHINSSGSSAVEDVPPAGEVEPGDTLRLPEGKLAAGRFQSVSVESRAIQHVHTLPGRLRYDATKHVAVKAPIDGILAGLLVTPGDAVSAGQVLAVLRSSQIGQARSDVLKQSQRLEIAEQFLDRQEAISANVEQLSAMLDAGNSTVAIEDAFEERPLGGYRQEILSAYVKLLLAEELLDKVKPLVSSGAVPGRMLRERENERQLAETAFRAVRDQSKFAVEQARLNAQADAAEVRRQVDLAWQAVDGLLGHKVDRTDATWDESTLSQLKVEAPFSGSIESCGYATDERVARGDDLMILANTDTLYVEASIRESDWSAVALKPGTTITVRVSAFDDQPFEAQVHYVGREVDSATNSIPLMATIDNSERLFRPGMFVRVTIPIGAPRHAIAVKPESVLQHENEQFVFVDLGRGLFKRVNIATGESSEDWVEVTSGLSPGQLVVTEGAFLLKSELLLQSEE